MLRDELDTVIDKLYARYPYGAECGLKWNTPLELLISTILSAQCTDVRVNKTTPALFERFPDAKAFCDADVHEIEEYIRACGLFRSKAANIKKCCETIEHVFGGSVPDNMDDLLKLAGTGRKTANLVLGEWFGQPAYVIDTHVKRIWALMGVTDARTPEAIEKDLRELIPPDDPKASRALMLSHLFITHGRETCVAQRPRCGECCVAEHCRYCREKNGCEQ